LKPGFAEAFYQLGLSTLSAGRYEEGCTALRTASELGITRALDAISRFCK